MARYGEDRASYEEAKQLDLDTLDRDELLKIAAHLKGRVISKNFRVKQSDSDEEIRRKIRRMLRIEDKPTPAAEPDPRLEVDRKELARIGAERPHVEAERRHQRPSRDVVVEVDPVLCTRCAKRPRHFDDLCKRCAHETGQRPTGKVM
jgi:hypothetical protein